MARKSQHSRKISLLATMLVGAAMNNTQLNEVRRQVPTNC